MQISAAIIDWAFQDELANGLAELDQQKGGSDSFTLFNDSWMFNDVFGRFFLRERDKLPGQSAEVLSQFLVNVCPSFYGESGLQADYDLTERYEDWIYAALSPERVRARLASLYEIDLWQAFEQLAELAEAADWSDEEIDIRPTDIRDFLFMWAAAHGQAASKQWGLIVTFG